MAETYWRITGSGEPLLLLHPFTTSYHVWRPVVERLRGQFDMLAPTMAGHRGGPALPAGDGSIVHKLADEVERVLDRERWPTAHVVGNSLGGLVSIELGRRGRARTVTAFAPAGGWYGGTRAERRLVAWFTLRMPLAKLAQLAVPMVGVPMVKRLAFRALCHDTTHVRRRDLRAIARAVSSCELYHPRYLRHFRSAGAHPLAGAACPVRIVMSEHDRLLPVKHYNDRFFAELPHATREVLAGVGHVPQLEAPDRVADAIRRHIAEAAAIAAAS